MTPAEHLAAADYARYSLTCCFHHEGSVYIRCEWSIKRVCSEEEWPGILARENAYIAQQEELAATVAAPQQASLF